MPLPSKTHALNLKCEHLPRPLGVGTPDPRLSWEIQSEGNDLMQSAYRIQLWNGDKAEGESLWDSGKINSSRQHEVTYSGAPLQVRSAYIWRVKVWLDDGSESDWSEPASFETGFFSMRDWKADWIIYSDVGGGGDAFGKESVNFVRREFNVKDIAHLKTARAFVAATAGAWGNDTLRMNLYEFRLNGAKVGNDHYNPGQVSDLKQRALYRAYDLSGLSSSCVAGTAVKRHFAAAHSSNSGIVLFGNTAANVSITTPARNSPAGTSPALMTIRGEEPAAEPPHRGFWLRR